MAGWRQIANPHNPGFRWRGFCFIERNTHSRRLDAYSHTTQAPAEPPRESFLLKSMLVASALFVAAVAMANQEFYMSAPSQALSETEVALRLPAR